MQYKEVEVDIKVRMTIPDNWTVSNVQKVLTEINETCTREDVFGTPEIVDVDDVMMKHIKDIPEDYQRPE